MLSLKHLVVLIDPAEDNLSALEKASVIAKTANSHITLFCSAYCSALTNQTQLTENDARKAQSAYLQRIKSSLEEKAATIHYDSNRIECIAVWDKHPSQAIIRYLESQDVDLVIKSTHHQNVMQRTFFSHTDWDLIRYSPVPLLLTKNQSWKGKLSVTASVDPVNNHDKPDALDREIISAGHFLATALNAELTVLHVYDPTPVIIYLDQPIVNTSDISEEIRQQHQEALQALVTEHKIPQDQVHLECGNPANVIPDHLYQYDSSVVVMGAVSRQGLDRLLVGHTAERILDRITADILVVKLEEETVPE